MHVIQLIRRAALVASMVALCATGRVSAQWLGQGRVGLSPREVTTGLAFRGSGTASATGTVDMPHQTDARWIGALVGAVALPAAGYAVFHDSDSGSPEAGGMLLVAAIGAVLGYMAGLIIAGDSR